MDEALTRKEHEEFSKRIEGTLQAHTGRLDDIDKRLGSINELLLSIQRISINVENLTKEIQRQGDKIEQLEAKPAKRWEGVVDRVITAAVGGCVAYILVQLGIGG